MKVSFKTKLLFAIGALAVGSTAGSAVFFYVQTRHLLFAQMGSRLEDIGRTAVHLFKEEDRQAIRDLKATLLTEMKAVAPVLPPIEAGEYKAVIPDERAEALMKGEKYQRLVALLRLIKSSTQRTLPLPEGASRGQPAELAPPTLAYATIITGLPAGADPSVVQFVADADYDKSEAPNPIGNLFHNNSTALRSALGGEVFSDRDFRFEQGEVLFSAGIPILEPDGKVLAILALDYDARSEANQVSQLLSICIGVTVASFFLSIGVAMALSTLFNRPLGKLKAGAERVALRDFSTNIELKNADEFGMVAQAFNSMVKEIREYAEGLERMNESYARFVPKAFLEQLGREEIVEVGLGDQVQKQMTVMFADIRSFSTMSENMSPRDNFEFLNDYLEIVSPIIREHGGFIDKYLGDGIMALFPGSVEQAIRAAIGMQQSLVALNLKNTELGRPMVKIGVGLHTGNLMLGTVGEKQRMEVTVISDAVNIAARIEGVTKEYGAPIIASERTIRNLSEGVRCHSRYLGAVELKGKKVPVRLFEIIEGDEEDSARRKIVTSRDFELGVKSLEKKNHFRAAHYFRKVLRIHRDDVAAKLYLARVKDSRNGGPPVGETVAPLMGERVKK